MSNDSDVGNSNKCLISRRGNDGIGHQMEAKLSCIGAAAMFPGSVAYVHRPLESDRWTRSAEGGGGGRTNRTAANDLEGLFGIPGALAALGGLAYDDWTMETVRREPLRGSRFLRRQGRP